jgi:hypothetical protein
MGPAIVLGPPPQAASASQRRRATHLHGMHGRAAAASHWSRLAPSPRMAVAAMLGPPPPPRTGATAGSHRAHAGSPPQAVRAPAAAVLLHGGPLDARAVRPSRAIPRQPAAAASQLHRAPRPRACTPPVRAPARRPSARPPAPPPCSTPVEERDWGRRNGEDWAS